MSYLLGIDVGTSSVKAVLFDESTEIITSASREYPLYQPKPLWAEQDPNDWWKAAAECIKEITSKVDASQIKGVGATGQMHGLVLLDDSGTPLCNSIIWCDQRTEVECDEITKIVGYDKLISITCNPALTGFTASKMLWMKKNKPEIFNKASHFLLPKDYIKFKLTNEYTTDVSDASGTQLLDIQKRQWSEEVANILGIPMSILPKVYESQDVVGTVTKEAAEATGLKEGTVVVAGAGDQAAAAVGCGIVKSGIASLTLGSSGVIFAHTDKPLIDKKGRIHTFCHAVPNKWHVMSVTQGAGLSLKWFKDNFCKAETENAKAQGKDVYNVLFDKTKDMPIGTEGLTFLPYLMGERSPILDPNAKGAFYGITNAHDLYHMFKAVAEGVVLSQYDCYKVLEGIGLEPSYIRMCGGGARNPIFRQMFSDCFGLPIVVTESPENGALGASILAGVGAGLYESVESACDKIVCSNEQKPNAENKAKYDEIYNEYTKLYSLVKQMQK